MKKYSPRANSLLPEKIKWDIDIDKMFEEFEPIIGGVMPKTMVKITGNIIAETYEGDFEYLIKSIYDDTDIPQNESFFLWLAEEAGLACSKSELIKKDDKYLFFSKNFLKEGDILISFGDLLSKEQRKNINLEDIFSKINSMGLLDNEKDNIFKDSLKQIVFSNLIGNFDLHAQNISLIKNFAANGMISTRVAPAYDITHTKVYFGTERASMKICGKNKNINVGDIHKLFIENTHLSHSEIINIIKDIKNKTESNIKQINNSLMDRETKEYSLSFIEKRLQEYNASIFDLENKENELSLDNFNRQNQFYDKKDTLDSLME